MCVGGEGVGWVWGEGGVVKDIFPPPQKTKVCIDLRTTSMLSRSISASASLLPKPARVLALLAIVDNGLQFEEPNTLILRPRVFREWIIIHVT